MNADANTRPDTTGADSGKPVEVVEAELVRRPWHERLHQVLAEHAGSFPRLVTEPQPSLAQHVDYARRGEWTASRDGSGRGLHVTYTWLVVVPVTTAALAVAWAVARPGRWATTLLVASVLATALNGVPVVGWLIPDWACWTSWPPLARLG